MSSTDTARTAAELIAEFIAAQLEEHRARWTARNGAERRAPPFVCAIQGPQGSVGHRAYSPTQGSSPATVADRPHVAQGKSYTASKLPDLLASLSSSAATPIRTAALSLDDLYLPHDGLVAVAAADPSNALLAGRGQAGTHDLALGVALLSALKNPSSATGGSEVLELPVFEKSLHGGAGDRVPREQWVRVERPSEVDVVIFEGWMNGFRPLNPPSALGELYRRAREDPARAKEQLGIDYEPPFLLEHREEHLAVVQDKLAAYRELWDMVDAFVQIRPEKMGFVWEWRLEVRPAARAPALLAPARAG